MRNLQEIEPIIVFNCLTNDEFFTTIEPSIEDYVFDDKDYRQLMKFRLEFYRKHKRIPKTTELVLEFGEIAKTVTQRAVSRLKEGSHEKVEGQLLYDSALEFVKFRKYHKYLCEQAEAFRSGKINIEDSFKEVSDIVGISFDTDLGLDFWKDVSKVITDVSRDSETISTGYRWLDHHLGGGWLKNGRGLYVFQGAANIGKSIWLGNVGTKLLHTNKNVLLISLEMSEGVYSKRLIADLVKIPTSHVSEDPEGTADMLKSIKENSTIGNLYVKEFPPSSLTVAQLDSFLSKCKKAGRHFDAIVIDYINLLKGMPGVSSYEKIKDIAESLRALTYKYEVPIITATQINRGKKQGGYGSTSPELDDVSESLALIQIADGVFGIWQEDGDAQLGNMNLSILKNRQGIRGVKTSFKIKYETLTIYEDSYTMRGGESKIEDDLDQLA